MFPIFRGWLLRGLVCVTYETGTRSVALHCPLLKAVMYALSRERVYYPDNDAGMWLPSRCLAMDARSDSDIPVFRLYATI
jgi:hypothetical protein